MLQTERQKMSEKNSKKQSAEEVVTQELNDFLKTHSAKLVPGLTFPIYNKLPLELELAVAVVKKHEPAFDIQVVLEEEPQPLSTPKAEK